MTAVLESLIIYLCLVNFAVAQDDPALKHEIDQLVEKYNTAPHLQLEFELKVVYPEQKPTLYNGSYYQQDNTFRVVFDEYEIYSDHKSQWTVFKENQEVQITSVEEEGAELSTPSGVLKYLDENEFRYFDKASLNPGSSRLRIIELIPEDKSSEYFKIRITKEKDSNLLKYIEVFARDGSRFQLTVKNSSFSANLVENSVEWNAENFKGFYIEDLRID